MPVALAGMYALIRQPQRELPDPAADGNGPTVRLILFSQTGERTAAISIHKIIKTDAIWRGELNSDEYAVTRKAATELAFNNRYWNNRDAGVYRCICCANALFRSDDKFDSGTGWPSFTRPIAGENMYIELDASLAEKRDEVLCRKCDAHLGHRFTDGPPPAGLRYCVNSVALQFLKYA